MQELLATGHITEAEARAHPRRNIVTRALGIEPTVRVDSWLMPMVRGDRFVLCSDGLVDEVDDDEIHEIIASQTKPQDCADSLVAAAVGHGGRDNVTVIVVDVLDGLDPDSVAGIPAEGDEDTVSLDRPRAIVDDELPVTQEHPVVESKVKQQLGRQMTVKTFLMLLGAAVVLTVGIVLIAVGLSGGDEDQPTPTVTTLEPATTVEPSTTDVTTTTDRATTTTRPRTTTTTSSVTTTTAP